MDIAPLKNKKDAEDFIRFHIEDTGCRWGIFYKDNGELIGTVGFYCWSKVQKKAEIGYDLKKNYWGKGIMTEALQMVIQFGFNHMDLHIIDANVVVKNPNSIKLLNKLSFNREKELRKNDIYFYLINPNF